MKKRLLSVLLAVMLLVSVLPTAVFAETTDGVYSSDLEIGADSEWAASLESFKGNEAIWNGHKYVRVETGMDWFAAKKYCEEQGGHLATITSAEEDDIVARLVKGGTKAQYWLGGTDEKEEGVWRWVTGEAWTYWGHLVTFDNYKNNEHYLQMDRHHWGDESMCGVWNDINYENHIWGEESFFSTDKIGLILEVDFDSSSWAQMGIQMAIDDGLFPECLEGQDLKKVINRQEFAAVAVKLYEAMSGTELTADPSVSFTDCKDADVLKAGTKVGAKAIVSGYGDGSFKPAVLLNRETAATMLGNVYLMINGYASISDVDFTMPAKFSDDAELSSWAKEYVYFMNSKGVISGYDNKNGSFSFRPKNLTSQSEAYGMCTREQALIIAEQMYQKLN